MWRKLKSWIGVLLITVLWVVICVKTYAGGTYLLGWDNLAPELGFGINISRALSTAWQEYQGVGLLGGMGHAADLTRQIMLWIASFVVPTSLLRWGWTLLMLVVGSLGVYSIGIFLFSSRLVAIVGAIFYLLNPVTIQVFNVPFETFTSFYGFVPWMIWGSLAYLRDGKRVDLIKLLVILLIGMSAFVVQTMFVVFVIILGILSVEYLIKHRDLKRLFKLWGVVVGVNLFWLLPVLWFGVTSSSVNVNAKMNLLATEEVELMNVAYGSLADLGRLNGWWLQNTDVEIDGKMILLMHDWTEWLANNSVRIVGSVIFVLMAVGLLAMFRKDQKNHLKLGWVVLLLLILTMLARRVEVFSQLYDYISRNIPLFGQMFRASYTKWSIPLILAMSVGLMSLMGLFRKRFIIVGWLVGAIVAGMTTYTVLPVFKDGIVGERMKVVYPTEYLNLFKYFSGAEMGRVAKLPANYLWGWNYNEWGYRGSGFLWYGIEQPILDRAFDVWSPYNEGFYNEFSNSIYKCSSGAVLQCGSGVASVLDKYDVRYVLLDESVIAPGQDKEILRIEETKKLAEELGWSEKFKVGFLTVWDTNNSQITNDKFSNGEQFVSAPREYSLIDVDVSKVRNDVVYDQLGTYTEKSGNTGKREYGIIAYYPFAKLMREEVEAVEYGENKTTIFVEETPPTFGVPTRDSLGSPVEESPRLVIPGWKVGDIVRVEFEGGEPIPIYYVNGEPGPRFLGKERPEEGKNIMYARISEGEEWGEYLKNFRFTINDSRINIEVPGAPQIYDFAKEGAGTIGNCDVLRRGTASKAFGQSGSSTVYVADERGAVCDYVAMGALDTRLPHLMRVSGKNVEGRSVKFFLYNTGSKRNDIEYLLGKGKFDQSFSILPWAWDGYYTLNIEARSFGQLAENRIDPVEVRYFPLEQIAGARVVSDGFKDQDLRFKNNLEVTYVKKTGTWLYGMGVKVVDVGEPRLAPTGLIKLSQGYDEGWVGLRVNSNSEYRISKLEHVKVDGWANGWIVDNSQISNGDTAMVVIFFWPQLLEYLGFGLLAMTIIVLVFRRK